MPINTSLLVAAPMLQDQLVDDQTGLPLANGTVTLYQDNSRTTFKNWYYQSGSPGAYTYITLPNPLTLSAAGTIVDNNGNDTIPFYYPYDEVTGAFEPYYIVVQDQFGAQKFVRQNFPFITSEITPAATDVTFKNLLVNGEFWRNFGSQTLTTPTNTFTLNGSTVYYATVAPSQHDGFTMPDIIFAKNSTGSVDVVSVKKFTLGSDLLNPIGNGVTPEFYFNLNCTGIGGGETSKYLQIPIALHVQNLTNVNASIVFYAQDVNNANNEISVGLLEFLGSGVSTPILPVIKSYTLTNGWTQYTATFTFPNVSGAALASSGNSGNGPSDDAWYLQFSFPANQTCNINLALPQLYLSTLFPTNDFQTYDEVNSIISSPRTGDLRISINGFLPYGWVPANDGRIAASNPSALTTYARANSDTFQLYSLLWSIAKPYDTGSGGNFNPICQMYTSAGAATDFGTTAVGDFNTNKALALTRAFGKVLLGTAPISSLLSPQSTTFTAINSGGLAIICSNNVNYFNGMPVVFTNTGGTLPTGLVANAVYYVANFGGTNAFNVATSFANALAGTVISYTNAGSGTNTVISAVVGSSEGEYAHTQLSAELATHAHGALGTPSGGTPSFVVDHTSGSISLGTGGSSTSDQTTTANAGLSTPFNVTQPGTFYNIFIKL